MECVSVITSVTVEDVKLKLIAVGNSVGVILPKELLARLRVAKGDSLHVLDEPDGVKLTPYDPDFADKMERVERIMGENRNLLRRLAE